MRPVTVADYREASGLSQRDFASRLGMNYWAYRSLEYGRTAQRPFHIMAAQRVLQLEERGVRFGKQTRESAGYLTDELDAEDNRILRGKSNG